MKKLIYSSAASLFFVFVLYSNQAKAIEIVPIDDVECKCDSEGNCKASGTGSECSTSSKCWKSDKNC